MLNEYHNDVRRHIEKNTQLVGYGGSLLPYQIGEDEIYDASLVSQRIYKTRVHSDVIRVACGVSYSHEPLPQKVIFLPTLRIIIQLMKKHGVTHA